MGFSFGRNKDRDTCSAAEEEIRTLRAALEAVELRVAALQAAARLPANQPAAGPVDVATDMAAGHVVTSVNPPSPVAARVELAQEAGAARLSAAQLSRLHTEAHEDEVTAVAISRGFSPAGASRRSAPASETPRFVAAGVGGRFPQTCIHSVFARIISDCHHTTHCAGSIILRRRTDPWTAATHRSWSILLPVLFLHRWPSVLRLLLRGADGRPLAPPVELPAAAEAAADAQPQSACGRGTRQRWRMC